MAAGRRAAWWFAWLVVVRAASAPCELGAKRRVIIEYSPIRSGSTVVYSLLRALFSEQHLVRKTHRAAELDARACVVSTVRMARRTGDGRAWPYAC